MTTQTPDASPSRSAELCEGCPPAGYQPPTRCTECPRRSPVVEPGFAAADNNQQALVEAAEGAKLSEDAIRDRLARARKTMARLQGQLIAAENARRASTPDCGRGNHDIEVTCGSLFTVYRCRRCAEEEWL